MIWYMRRLAFPKWVYINGILYLNNKFYQPLLYPGNFELECTFILVPINLHYVAFFNESTDLLREC